MACLSEASSLSDDNRDGATLLGWTLETGCLPLDLPWLFLEAINMQGARSFPKMDTALYTKKMTHHTKGVKATSTHKLTGSELSAQFQVVEKAHPPPHSSGVAS